MKRITAIKTKQNIIKTKNNKIGQIITAKISKMERVISITIIGIILENFKKEVVITVEMKATFQNFVIKVKIQKKM